MSALTYLSQKPDAVLDALRRGEITAIDEATEQVPDFFVLYALESGLLDQLASSFPDPRLQQPEIPMRILLAAGIAGHFAGLYALSQLPYALHSPRLLAELGVQVAVNQPGQGLSRRGTKEEAPFHGDVLRKLLEQIAKQDRKEKRLPGQTLIDWYNTHVGIIYCRAVNAQPCIHILDCTDVTVTFKNDHYELSSVTSRQEWDPAQKKMVKVSERGYKLGTLRSLLDQGAVMTAIAWDSIEKHDLNVTHDLVRNTLHLRPGDILLKDRGFIDGATITFLKKERGVDVYTGLKSDMLLMRAAIAHANCHPHAWRPHPTRKNQQIQLVTGLSAIWHELGVPMNVCVVRFKDKKTKEWSYLGFITTDLTVSARQIMKTYQTRPEIEEDYRQLKSPAWHIDKFCATRLIQILWHILLTLCAYNLFQIYANTEQGREFAGKTKQKIEREQQRKQETYLVVCTENNFGVYKTKDILYITLDLPDDVRAKIRTVLAQRKE